MKKSIGGQDIVRVLLAALNAKYMHTSLAVRYLREYCRDAADIQTAEFTINHNLLEIVAQLFEQRPAVLGLACYIWNIDMVLSLTALLKKVLPQLKIILGGPEVSYNAAELMQQHSEIDAVVCGEGEQPLLRLLLSLHDDSKLENLAGLALRAADGRIIGGEAVTLAELSQLPFPYIEKEIAELKEKILYYESSRGCPFSCRYCLSCATSGVRFLSLDRVLKELSWFVSHNVRQVKFVDRTFNADKRHFLPIWEFIAGLNACRTNFHFEIAADLLDEEALALLERMPAGRIQLEIGVQSTHEPTLAAVNRSNNWPRLSAAVRRIVSRGNIHVHLDLIVGLPYETYEIFARSFNEVYALRPHMLQIGFLKMLRGAEMRRCIEQFHYVFMDMAPYQILSNDAVSAEQVFFLRRVESVFEQYYNAGRFQHTLTYLQIGFDGAFAMYEALTEFWQKQGCHLQAHGLKELYEILAGFARMLNTDRDVVLELLKFDALLSDGGRIRPEFLSWNDELWRQQRDEFWRGEAEHYLPEFVLSSWRELKRRYHIEVFEYRVTDELMEHRRTAVLFDYTGEQTKYTVLPRKFVGRCNEI